MSDFVDFCEVKKGNKKPVKQCTKNLNIRRVNMPQITNAILLREFIKLCELLNYRVKKDVILRNIHKKNIYTSQKEVNETKALQIPTRLHHDIPVIMLKKSNEYMVLDGHHRWLAHHLKRSPLKIIQIEISNTDTLETAFIRLNKIMKKSGKNFHPRHSITHTKKKNEKTSKTRKRIAK
jgi:hypothetical protein